MSVKCFVCGEESEEVTYIKCVHKGEEKTACVRCLPALIHGSH